VEVDRVLFEKVRAHDHAHVRQCQKELVILVDGHQGGGYIPVHYAYIHNRPGIYVPIDGIAIDFEVLREDIRNLADRAVVRKQRESRRSAGRGAIIARRIRCGWIAGRQRSTT
jgi:hypothetical protein